MFSTFLDSYKMRQSSRVCWSLLKIVKEKCLNESKVIFPRLAQARTYLQIDCEERENAYIHHQQKRSYVPKAPNSVTCWNCKEDNSGIEVAMKCQKCGSLQDVDANINYFELLTFPEKFDLEAQALTKRFRQLQTMVHPDKFSNKDSREQSNSADWSSLINKAYKTLSMPLERGEYLLELKGFKLPQDNSTLDKEFLMEMMERNEEVEDASTKIELGDINERLTQELKKKLEKLTESFSENKLEMAKIILIEMKYLISIQKTIKNKLQALLDS